MPYKDKEYGKAMKRLNYHKNKERILAEQKEYYQKNKEAISIRNKIYKKKYYHKNKETIAEKNKQYYKENPEVPRIAQWKRRGIIDGDYYLLNEAYEKETHCWICWQPYIGTRTKALDHDWSIKDDSNVRYICCKACNTFVVG